MPRPVRGYVLRGECRSSRSCYVMGCQSAGCREAHRQWTVRNRLVRLQLARATVSA